MHLNRLSLARKIIAGLGLAGLALLSGCTAVQLTNLTPSSLQGNPSDIYTFTLRIVTNGNRVVPGTLAAHIVVDGQEYAMQPSPLGAGIYDFDYQLPAGRSEVAYYFLVNYQLQGSTQISPDEAYTAVSKAEVVRRYVLSLEANRGPVGAHIDVIGRGFTVQDGVSFNGTPARTVFESPTSLGFFVPPLPTGQTYAVSVNGPAGNSTAGTFRIDGTGVTVDPASLTLAPGQQQSLTFTVPNPAPAGGLLLDVTTDVPESVIMPEVIVPAGANSVTVTVQGGKPGTGSLFLKGYANGGDVTIPVTVSDK